MATVVKKPTLVIHTPIITIMVYDDNKMYYKKSKQNYVSCNVTSLDVIIDLLKLTSSHPELGRKHIAIYSTHCSNLDDIRALPEIGNLYSGTCSDLKTLLEYTTLCLNIYKHITLV